MILSSLGHTWIIDIDGTICKHNGYKTDGFDTLLQGVCDLFSSIPQEDMIILLTSRSKKVKMATERFLKENGIRYDIIIYNCPFGERILINDQKPSGLVTARSYSPKRDQGLDYCIEINENI